MGYIGNQPAETPVVEILETDFKIGEDDQTKIDFADANTINFHANNAKEMVLAENSLSPGTSDGTALGTASLMWSDLFLASGSVINLNNGNVTITHSSNTLTVAAATVAFTASTAVTVSNDLKLSSDSAILSLGADDDATLTHDGTTGLTIAANPITLDSGADIVLDAAGNDFNFKAGGTEVLRITNSSSDVIIKPIVDAKDLIFQQRDGTEVARVEDNGTFNIVTDKLAINGTAVTATAAELNLIDGGTSVGGSITLADADGFVVNDDGTMKTIPASDVKTYAGISGDITLGTDEKLILDTTPSDDDGSGVVIKGTIASGVNAGETVYLKSNGEYARADKNAESTMPAVGVALEASGSNKKILVFGVIRNAGFSLTQGEEVYQSDNGFMTSTVPGSGDFLQRLGVALDSTHVLFTPSLDVIEHA